MNLEDIGITKDDLVERIVQRVAVELGDSDDDIVASKFERAIKQKIDALASSAVSAITKTNVAGAVNEVINGPWRRTNQYGETKETLTFREMVTDRIDLYLKENVTPHDGSTVDRYSSGGQIPRLDWLIRKEVAEVTKTEITKAASEAAASAKAQVLGAMDAAVIAAVRNVLGIKA